MDRIRVRSSIEAGAEIDYARSGGPGGQNVNKVNSKAVVRIALGKIEGLEPREMLQLRSRLAARITAADELVAASDEERDQARNRQAALDRLVELAVRSAAVPKPRKKTEPSRAAKERRLGSKRARSATKRLRGGGGAEDAD